MEGIWPAAVGFDDFVDLGHEADGFSEDNDGLGGAGEALGADLGLLGRARP